EAMLLRLVETFVERTSCVCELLQPGGTLAHHLGARVKAIDRIFRSVGIGARSKAIRALLGEIAQSGFDRRPTFFLIRLALQPGMKGGQAGVPKGRECRRPRGPGLRALEIILTFLRIGKWPTSDRKRSCSGKNRFPHCHLQWRYLYRQVEECTFVLSS